MGNSLLTKQASFYPVGAVYMTTKYSFDPNTYFGGTWVKITTDAYLKIVNDNNLGGVAGGTSSDHKIPIESIPAHTHTYTYHYSWSSWTDHGSGDNVPNRTSTSNTGSSGGGNAYYPYYIGVYVWKRTA